MDCMYILSYIYYALIVRFLYLINIVLLIIKPRLLIFSHKFFLTFNSQCLHKNIIEKHKAKTVELFTNYQHSLNIFEVKNDC